MVTSDQGKHYTPSRGDIVWLDLDPALGHEQQGRRPVLIVSNQQFNRLTGMAIVCPITQTSRGYATHVPLQTHTSITGVIMTEQCKSLHYGSRKLEYIESVDPETLEQVLVLIKSFIWS